MFYQRLRAQAMSNGPDGFHVGKAFESLFRTQNLKSAGMRINGGSASPQWGTTNALVYLTDGVMSIYAALTGKAVPAACTFSAVSGAYQATGFIASVDSAGNSYTYPCNIASSTVGYLQAIQALQWPTVPAGQTVIGAVVIYTTASNVGFTAGSTNLDAANISTAFIDTVGPTYPAPVL